MCTLVDNEAVFREISSGNATTISSQQKEDFGGIFPDNFNTSLVAQVQCCYLASNSIHIKYKNTFDAIKKDYIPF